MGVGTKLQQFGEQLRESITAGAKGELDIAKQGYEMRQDEEKAKIKDPVKFVGSLMSQAARAESPEQREQIMKQANDAWNLVEPLYKRMQNAKALATQIYGTGPDGEVLTDISTTTIPVGPKLLEMSKSIPQKQNFFQEAFSKGEQYLREKLDMKQADPESTMSYMDWKNQGEQELRSWFKERNPDADKIAEDDFIMQSMSVFDRIHEGEIDLETDELPGSFKIMQGKGYRSIGPKKVIKGQVSREKGKTKKKMDTKVWVKKGDEVLEIDIKDLGKAQKDGYKRVKR